MADKNKTEASSKTGKSAPKAQKQSKTQSLKVGSKVTWTDPKRDDVGTVLNLWKDPRGIARAHVEWGESTEHTGAKVSDLQLVK